MDWLVNGLPVEGEEPSAPRAIDAVSTVPTCGIDATTSEAQASMGDQHICVVINKAGIVLGLLRTGALAGVDGGRPVAQLMRPGPATFRPGVPAGDLARYLDEHDAHQALLTTAEGRLVGVAARRDLDPVTRPSAPA